MTSPRLLALLLPLCTLVACTGANGLGGDGSDCIDGSNGSFGAGGGFSGGGNEPPTAPEVRISPDEISSADPFHCLIWTPSEDPDGDDVYYRFQWLVDDEDSGVTSSAVHSWEASGDSVWTCIATPNDGTVDGPSAQAEITVIMEDPHVDIIPPVVKILPEEPTAADDLECVIVEAAVHPQGVQITYFFGWRLNGQNNVLGVSDIPAAETSIGDEWTCSVTPMMMPCEADCKGPAGEDTATILDPG
jgi:hypothetical protein